MPVDEVMHGYRDAVRRGDFDSAYGFFADDIVVRIPGRSVLAGERRGKAAAIEYVESARALSHGRDVELEVVDVLTSADRFALIVHERFHRADGGVVEIRRANVYRVEGERITEVWIFEGDQYEVDALLGG
jgi:uncharacterized protein